MGRWPALAGWLLLALFSAAASWAAWTLPPRADPPPAPPALDRPPSPHEQATVHAQLRQLQAELDNAGALLGQPLPMEQLEGLDAQGQPWLPSGLPDNPLRPGVSGVVQRCPPIPRSDDPVDWIYCDQDGRVAAVGLSPG